MKTIVHEVGRDPLYKIWHATRSNMILYVHSGDGSIVLQDKIYHMRAGTLCFIGSGRQHYTMPDDPTSYDRSKIYASDTLLGDILATVPRDSDFATLFKENSVIYAVLPDEIACDAEAAFLQAMQGEGKDCELFVLSYLKLMALIKQYAGERAPTKQNDIATVIEYVNRFYSQPLTLDDVCKEVHTCKHHLCRKFKKAMGITVMEYVTRTRIAAAKDMLRGTDLPVGEVAWRCGFSGASVFSQSFREAVGVTASRYRKTNQKQ